MADMQFLSSMNKIPCIVGICLAVSIFYTVYSPHSSMVKQHMDTYGMDFEYVTPEGSCFTQNIEPIGHDSHKYILSLGKPAKPAIAEEPLYVMVGYTMKQVRLKNKSNVFQSQLSNTLYDKAINYPGCIGSDGS
jgi:hypothetical protein